ncbi:MAG: LuxR C-terminal-related transcriptional regulator [Planctomycetota bacterium]
MSKSSLPDRQDMSSILACAARLADVSKVDDFYAHVTAAMAELLPGVDPSCELIDIKRVKVLAGHTVSPVPPHLYELFLELFPHHPMIQAWLRAGGEGVFWSDPYDPRAIRMEGNVLYEQVLSQVGIESQYLVSSRIDDTRRLTIMFSSKNRFNARERNLMAMVRKHLLNAFISWERIQASQSVVQIVPEALAQRFNLSKQRSVVLSHLIAGRTNAEMSEAMGLSVGTIRKHVELLLRDMGANSRHEAATMALSDEKSHEA